MFLVINTSDNKEFYLTLLRVEDGTMIDAVQQAAPFQQEEFFLKTLNHLLKKNNKQIDNITGIVLVDGQGSFSSLRIGATVANTLAWIINIPVTTIAVTDFSQPDELYKLVWAKLSNISDPDNHFVNPRYGREPNIN